MVESTCSLYLFSNSATCLRAASATISVEYATITLCGILGWACRYVSTQRLNSAKILSFVMFTGPLLNCLSQLFGTSTDTFGTLITEYGRPLDRLIDSAFRYIDTDYKGFSHETALSGNNF